MGSVTGRHLEVADAPEVAEGQITYLEAIQRALRDALLDDDRVFLLGEDIGTFGGAFGVTKLRHHGSDGTLHLSRRLLPRRAAIEVNATKLTGLEAIAKGSIEIGDKLLVAFNEHGKTLENRRLRIGKFTRIRKLRCFERRKLHRELGLGNDALNGGFSHGSPPKSRALFA